MATFGPIADPSPNVLFNPLAVDAQVQAMQRNRLLMQQAVEDRQVARADREREEVGRVSASLMSLPAEARPAAYSAAVADLRKAGIAMGAPAEYPGDARIEQLARAAMPAAMQFQLAEKQRAAQEMNALTGFLQLQGRREVDTGIRLRQAQSWPGELLDDPGSSHDSHGWIAADRI